MKQDNKAPLTGMTRFFILTPSMNRYGIRWLPMSVHRLFRKRLPLVKESQDGAAAMVKIRVFRQRQTLSRPRQRNTQNLADGRSRAVGHHDYAIGQQHRLV